MSVSKKVRECDKFGAKVSLTHEGRDDNGTLGGGAVSLCLSSLTLAYFCMQILAVSHFDDPKITNYKIMENRGDMETSINIGEYKQ